MHSPRPIPYAARHLVIGAVAVLALAACGKASAPEPGQTPVGSTAPIRALTDQPVEADGGLRCPASLASAEPVPVPQKPQGVDGAARLLPDGAPTSLVVCAYPVMDVMATRPLTAPFRLTKRTVATDAQRAKVVETMTWAPRWNGKPRACTMMAGNETAYVVGAAYDDAIVWVAAKADANSCSTSTNGDFTSGAPLGVDLDAVFGTRGRPASEAAAACTARSWGRLGDDRSLAPEGNPKVTVCRTAVDGSLRPTALDPSRSEQVVAALRGLTTRPTGQTCEGSGKASDARFTLVLAYAAGPTVRIAVDPDCTPAVLGSNLESEDGDSLVALVDQWSPRIPGPDPNGSVSSDGSVAPALPAPSGGPTPDLPTEVPGSSGSGSKGSLGLEPAVPSDVPTEIPMTR